MTLDQLLKFAEGESLHDTRRMLTREQARALCREIEAERDAHGFDLAAHLKPRQPINVLHSTCEKLRGHQVGTDAETYGAVQ